MDFCAGEGIVVEAYSPLTKGTRLSDPKLVAVAKKYLQAAAACGSKVQLCLGDRLSHRSETKSTAQILIRWALQHGLAVIPKSANRKRIFEDADILTLKLPQRIWSSSIALMKTSEPAGIRLTHRKCGDFATRKIPARRSRLYLRGSPIFYGVQPAVWRGRLRRSEESDKA